MTKFAVIASEQGERGNLRNLTQIQLYGLPQICTLTLCFRKAQNDKTLVILSFRKKAKYP